MKKTAIAAAILAGCCTQLAHAQSSVTLYGIVDTGIAYVNSVSSSLTTAGSRRFSEATGFGSGDRIGFNGVEDLGGGTSAIFTLENGFSGANGTLGQGGRMFGRQAFVGLSNNTYGKFTMGRQYDFTFDYVAPLLSWLQFGSIYGAHIGDVDDSFQTYRLNNSIKYELAPAAGLTVGGLYAFSNQASGPAGAGFANNRAAALGVRYNNGPLRFASSFLTVSNPSAGIAGSTNTGGAVGDEYTGSTSIFYNAGFVTRQRVFAIGSGYTWGPASVNFVFSDARLDYLGGNSIRVDNYEINGKYFIEPNLFVGLGYIYTDGSGFTGAGANSYASGTKPKWHQINAGIDYLLSKRTDIHLSSVYQRAAGDATAAALNVVGPSGVGTKSQLLILAGLRHRF